MTGPVLSVEDLTVSYRQRGDAHRVLSSVSFEVRPAESFGLVGESGCGKTTAALALVRHLPPNACVERGAIRLEGQDLLSLDDRELQNWRGRRVAMVYQEPGSALHPSMRVGEQVAEVYRFHFGTSKAESLERAREMFERVALPDPGTMLRRYAHQLSGGQQQRVVIAMALAADPRLLVLDEPTTALDATVEAEVLDLIAGLREELDTATVFISHNLRLITKMCERVAVLYAGRIVEEGPADDVFGQPRHPYTRALVGCVPRLGVRKDRGNLEPIPGALPPLGASLPGCYFEPRCSLARPECQAREPDLFTVSPDRTSRCFFYDEVAAAPLESVLGEPPVTAATAVPGPRENQPVLQVREAVKSYKGVVALDEVSLEVHAGEIFGLVGESGSGKSTLARSIAGLTPADRGEFLLRGHALAATAGRRPVDELHALQMVFQSPDLTLNPRQTVRRTLVRAIKKLRGARTIAELARDVRLDDRHLDLRAQQLSGGLKQRVAIARAFAGNPELVLCDEPVSALDVSVQAAILNLLAQLQAERHTSYIFISHDLTVVQYLADRIGVMYLGQLVEIGRTEQVFAVPHHPYTEALLSASAALGGDRSRDRVRLRGTIPNPSDRPSGCHFHTRCPRKLEGICEREAPAWQETEHGHRIRCHIPWRELRAQQLAAQAAADGVPEITPSSLARPAGAVNERQQ